MNKDSYTKEQVEREVLAAVERGARFEREHLVEVVRGWKANHPISDNTEWYIQNLLGDYLGKSSEIDEIREILKGE